MHGEASEVEALPKRTETRVRGEIVSENIADAARPGMHAWRMAAWHMQTPPT